MDSIDSGLDTFLIKYFINRKKLIIEDILEFKYDAVIKNYEFSCLR